METDFSISIPLETSSLTTKTPTPYDKNVHREAYLYTFIKTQIEELERANKDIPNFQREYLEKLSSILKEKLFILDKSLKPQSNFSVYYSNPERAIADIFQKRQLVLPCITFHVEDNQGSLPRRKPDFNFNIMSYFDPIKRRAERIISRSPKAVDLTLKVSLLAKYTEDLAQLVEQVELMFNPSLLLDTGLGNSTQAFLIDWTDESIKVTPSSQDRILIKACIISVEGYIPQKHYLMTSSGKIQEINFSFKT